MSKRSYVAIALLLGASLIGCQTTGLAPLPPKEAIVSTSLGAKDGGTIVVRLATQSALRIMAEAVKLADVAHFTVKLYQAPVGVPNPATDGQVGTTMTLPATGGLTGEFKDLPLGEYYLAVDALDASAQSLIEGGGPVLSAKVNVSSAGTTYPLSVDVQLRHATGGESTITITAPATFTGTKKYGLTLVDRSTKEVVSRYRSNTSTVQLKALKDGDYDLWIYAADETAKKATPARPARITVSGGGTTAGAAITVVMDPKMKKVSSLATAGQLWALAIGPNGHVYASMVSPPRVYNATTSSLIAGGGLGNGSDGADAIGDVIGQPMGISVDAQGDVFVADRMYHRLRRISAGKIYHAVPVATSATGVALNDLGQLYYSVRPANLEIYQLGVAPLVFSTGNNSHLNANMACDMSGNIYYSSGNVIRMRVLKSGEYFGSNRVAGTTSGDLPRGDLTSINGLTVDQAGHLYAAGTSSLGQARVIMVTNEGVAYNVAGSIGAFATLVDGAVPTGTELGIVGGLTVSAEGDIYVAAMGDSNYQVWKID